MTIDWTKIEAKWQKRWSEQKEFETDPNDKPKKFITVAYPYPNSPQHIGHGRTYTLADVHARFLRMRGYNVLFPMGFHYTGTPVLGMARRIQAKEKEIIDGLLNIYKVPEEAIKTFVDPIKIADYFHQEIKQGMIEMGYSIDWRREFTTIVPGYQRFIEWQITTLKKLGKIIQGSHPVGWCPRDENPVSQHDTMGDVEPKIDEKNQLIKFQLDGAVFPVTTLRPETIFGITNLWANPNTTYKRVTVDNEQWIISEQCAKKLEFFGKSVSIESDVSGSELIGKKAIAPHSNEPVIILSAEFVDPNMGTGLVMSVPAHAPKDYQALLDRQKTNDKHAQDIIPIPIISSSEYGEIPAKDICDKLNITSQTDEKLEDATTELYLKEFVSGVLGDRCGEFAGQSVEDGRANIIEWLKKKQTLEPFPVLENGPIRCRCGQECVVKILNNQWFLNYGDQSWKESARSCFKEMNILPNKIEGEFNDVIDWLHERACARQQGLGTKLPWDKDWIVESLSDSVIYMAYYVISKFVNDKTISPENLTPEFFDCVFLDKSLEQATQTSKLDKDTIQTIKNEFEYFYPVDSRHSGRDLIQNHLSFFVLNHVAIFPEKKWPQEIVVNGSVMMDGAKMSKSMGNIIPLRSAIKQHGADPIRLAIISSAELLQDADFDMESVHTIQKMLESILNECKPPTSSIGSEFADKTLLVKTKQMIRNVVSSMEQMRLREALHEILFVIDADIKQYLKYANSSGTLHKVYSERVKMLAPFAPHIAEEMWEKLGYTTPVTEPIQLDTKYTPEEKSILQSSQLQQSIIQDISKILDVTKMTPKKIVLYVNTDKTRTTIYRKILEIMVNGQNNMGPIMKELIANPDTAQSKKMPDFVQKVIKELHSESEEIKEMRQESFDEKKFLLEQKTTLEKEFGVPVEVYSESDPDIYDPKNKARHAIPYKPAILIE